MRSPGTGVPIPWGIGQIESDLDKVHLGSNTAFLDDEVTYNYEVVWCTCAYLWICFKNNQIGGFHIAVW